MVYRSQFVFFVLFGCSFGLLGAVTACLWSSSVGVMTLGMLCITTNICLTMDVLASGVLCHVAGYPPVGYLCIVTLFFQSCSNVTPEKVSFCVRWD